MSNYKSKTTVYEKRADGSLFPLGQVVPNIDERVRQLENYPSAVVVTKPTIDGSLNLPEGAGSIKFNVSAQSLLPDSSITKFEYWLNNGEKQSQTATLNSAIITIETPEEAIAGNTFDLYVRAYDNFGSSNINSVTLTVVTVGVSTPTIQGKTEGVVKGEATFTGSEFVLIGGEGNHDKSDWVLYKQSASSVEVWSSKNDTENLTTTPTAINDVLESGESYILKLRYHDATMDLWSEYGSITFTMANIAVKTPVISGETTDVIGGTATFTSSPFEMIGVDEGSHDKSDWVLYKASAPESEIWSSRNDSLNKISSPQSMNNILEVSTTYIIKVRYHDATTGSWSDYGQLEFTTANVFFENFNDIGVPGEKGFGVGVCDDVEGLAALKLTPMVGCYDINSDNYGNYQHESAGIFVYVPAWCYSFNDLSEEETAISNSYFKIKPFKDFNFDETAANEAGYTPHRAFLDGGVWQKGFFVSKYLMSKGNVSVKGGMTLYLSSLPLGTKADETAASGSEDGGYGNFKDAYCLSKKIAGGQYNCMSAFMASAISMLALKHGWHASSAENCAWYDPTGTNNFPKGANNNALGCGEDSTLLYSSSDKRYPQKPDTGSANYFSKTTHNGQNCGISDVSGCMDVITCGFVIAHEVLYIQKAETKLTDITVASVAKPDINGFFTKVDLKTSKIPDNMTSGGWGSTTGQNAFNTDSYQENYINYALCGVLPNKYSARTKTNEFGNDTYEFDIRQPSIGVNVNGSFARKPDGGIWYRYTYGLSGTDTSTTAGFRAACYLPS